MRSRKWSTKRGGEHHRATGHGPMVQGGLLTTHPGGVHCYGWSPRGGSSFRRGAEQLLQAAPIFKRRRRRYRGEFAKVRSILGVSTPRAKYRRSGAPGGPTSQPGGSLAPPRVGPRPLPSWLAGGGPPPLPLLQNTLPVTGPKGLLV